MIVEFIRKKSPEGGAGSFQTIFENFLILKSCKLVYYGEKVSPQVCFVISGTKHIYHLIKSKFYGIKIVQRLDGYNWRINYKKDPWLGILRMKIQNYIMNIIRKYVADEVVYQSRFVQKSWDIKFGTTKKRTSVILNCADKKFFQQPEFTSTDYITLTCVEGHLQDDQTTRDILFQLNQLSNYDRRVVEIEVYGKVINKNFYNLYKNINFKGHIRRSEVSKIYGAKKRIFFCLEINPPCPNSLIEAIASLVPCIGFDTGSFKEIVCNAGIAIPFGADPWSESSPNSSKVNISVKNLIDSYDEFSHAASILRKRYDPLHMCESYYKLLGR